MSSRPVSIPGAAVAAARFDIVLVANRGAIACRIIRTLRALGLRSVAVYSEADADSAHVAQADLAVCIGPAPAAQSYLDAERILAVAKETGAGAIHPGYGFLSENAGFAQACEDAGIAFIGPTPGQMRAFGLKHTARALAEAHGVPLLPGSGLLDDLTGALAEAARIGYPVMLKSTAGGGGIGMRLVRSEAELAPAFEAVARLARANFKDAGLFLEKFVERARHVEVQLFGNGRGDVVALGERDCSAQRRNQKVIEETPAPGLDPATRMQLLETAGRLGRAVGYRSAGTVEFVLDADSGAFYFLEVNTRLQVEHGVTEQVTGIDLVAWMVRLARGDDFEFAAPAPRGASIQVRLYAEDPARNFQPSAGLLTEVRFPADARVETWVGAGSEVPSHYDPMIAKLIARGLDREDAIARLSNALLGTSVWPVRTNGAFLIKALADPDFAAGNLDTGLIARKGDAWLPPRLPSDEVLRGAAWRLIENEEGETPRLPGFRLNAPQRLQTVLDVHGTRVPVDFVEPAENWYMRHLDDRVMVNEEGQTFAIRLARFDGATGASAGDGAILAPMPGRVTSVEVAAGEAVTKGQRLVTLEAMKMEHGLTAPFDGTIAELNVTQGSQVSEGALLVKVEKAD